MEKIQNISEIHPTLDFTKFDILEKYRKNLKKREFEIKLENRQLPVIDKIYINGRLLLKKAVCCDSRQKVGYKVTE